ncbi:N-acetylneuraminate synthase [Paenibacillus daejeonensis]|uniref:N-acetylneuraminate synthase n=1 Tax=Paenibacillus daejeonensis TaxID=135193 RepID=UPI000377D4A2|nr:N-acetylneuraminate synthase [Paenibacillus daejeonensis]
MLPITSNVPVYVIAEIGVNHNGSPALARQLIRAAASCGADAVKIQLFQAELLASRDAPLADYQQKTQGEGVNQFELLRGLELSEQTAAQLKEECADVGIDFLATPFDSPSLRFLTEELAAPCIKLGSGELTNLPFLLEAARYRRRLLLSTGMSTLAEVEQALAVIAYGLTADDAAPALRPPSLAAFRSAYVSSAGQNALRQQVSLLHATSEYPAPPESCNLRSMDTLHSAFGLPVGLSDHSEGIAVAIAAAARGAAIVEKHLTLDRTMDGVDHQASLEPEAFARMVLGIRQASQALGSPAKLPVPAELRTAGLVRRSIVAAVPIHAGELYTERNLALKRPGSGLPPERYWELLGTPSGRDYRKDDMIE